MKKLAYQPITMDNIIKRAKILSQIAVDEGGKINIHLLSDTISKFPLSGEDIAIARDAKNAAKFFDPDFTRFKDPRRIARIGKSTELLVRLSFLNLKVKIGQPKFDAVISRGTRFSYKLDHIHPDLSSPQHFFLVGCYLF